MKTAIITLFLIGYTAAAVLHRDHHLSNDVTGEKPDLGAVELPTDELLPEVQPPVEELPAVQPPIKELPSGEELPAVQPPIKELPSGEELPAVQPPVEELPSGEEFRSGEEMEDQVGEEVFSGKKDFEEEEKVEYLEDIEKEMGGDAEDDDEDEVDEETRRSRFAAINMFARIVARKVVDMIIPGRNTEDKIASPDFVVPSEEEKSLGLIMPSGEEMSGNAEVDDVEVDGEIASGDMPETEIEKIEMTSGEMASGEIEVASGVEMVSSDEMPSGEIEISSGEIVSGEEIVSGVVMAEGEDIMSGEAQ